MALRDGATHNPRPNSVWEHVKGDRYEVISIATGKSSDTPEPIEGRTFVYYTPLTGSQRGCYYIRPLAEFVDGRFTEIDPGGSQYY